MIVLGADTIDIDARGLWISMAERILADDERVEILGHEGGKGMPCLI